MPIRILNSGINLEPEPNTDVAVIFRNEVGVVCRTSACVQNRKTRRGSLLRRGSQDTGGSAAAASLDRHHTTLLGPATNTINAGDGSNGEGGMGSAPHDMTSVFGLEVMTIDAISSIAPHLRDGEGDRVAWSLL